MRVGFDAKRLFTNLSGLGNYGRTLVEALVEFHPELQLHLYTPRIRRTEQTASFLDSKSHRTFHFQGKLGSYWRSFSIKEQLGKDGIEVYHGLSNELPFGKMKSGIRSVLTVHDLIFKVFPDTYPFLDRQIYDLKMASACRIADMIVAISENTKQDLIRFYNVDPSRIKVVYQSCSKLYYDEADKAEGLNIREEYGLPEDYILCVGSIKKRKNLSTLIQAHSQLDKNCAVPLVIVGEGREAREVQAHFSEEKKGSIIWLNDLTNDDHLRQIYRSASLFVYPSLYEGFGLPVVEAMLSGTPVITSNSSSLSEAGGPKTVYFDPHSTDELVDAMERVLQDQQVQNEMIAAGKDHALDRFSRENAANAIVRIYQGLLGS